MMMGARLLIGIFSLLVLIANVRGNGLDPRTLSIDDIPPCGVCRLNPTTNRS